jgi:hypothetical protein
MVTSFNPGPSFDQAFRISTTPAAEASGNTVFVVIALIVGFAAGAGVVYIWMQANKKEPAWATKKRQVD